MSKHPVFSVLVICIFLFVLFFPTQPGDASQPQIPGAASLSLTPTSAAPGATILLRGTGFPSPGTVNVYWDWGPQTSTLLGLGNFGSNGDFALPVVIPPTASAGEYQVRVPYGRTDSISIAVNVTAPNRKAVYIYDFDQQSATEYKVLLDANGILTDLLPLNSIGSNTDFSAYNLILVGHDTGYGNSWGTALALQRLGRTRKPVVALGEGGYALLGKFGMAIGYPNGMGTSQKTINLSNNQEPVYHTPYEIALQGGGAAPYFIDVYSAPVNGVVIYQPDGSLKTYPFGTDADLSASYFPVIQQGRYLLWGYEAGPPAMTFEGQELFANLAWYLVTSQEKDTLILVDPARFHLAGYDAVQVADMHNAINSLISLPASTTNMKAVLRNLDLHAPAAVKNSYAAWDLSSVASTNQLAADIDTYIENLKGAAFPNLKYIILVGSHEVIPMKLRPADNYHENGWSIPAPLAGPGYMNSFIQSTYNGALGYYQTDTIYSDLSTYFDGWGTNHELVPELSVGRLVETPAQITGLINNYINSNASLSRTLMASIASWDYMDGGQAAANYMGGTTDSQLLQSTFNSSDVPPKINLKNDIVYLGGHGNYNWMTTGNNQGFMAGADVTQGDTEELQILANAVIVASGCHNGFNITSMHQAYTGNTEYGDFPERFAEREVGIYLGSTGFTWISTSGSSKNISDVAVSEKLATLFLDKLLNHGVTTAGKAFQKAAVQYASEAGTWKDYDRRVLAIATFYGIPNYRFSTPRLSISQISGYSLTTTPWFPPLPKAPAAGESHLVLDITNWTLTPEGVVEIPGASYTADKDHPILPVINVTQLLPESGGMVTPTLNLGQSQFITLNNDIPLPSLGTFDEGQLVTDPGSFWEMGFFPSSLIYTDTAPLLGGAGLGLGLNVIPVQYDKDLHQTRIWTKLVFDLEITGEAGADGQDTDGDGLPDYWEENSGLDPDDSTGDNGALGDPDLDGLSNQAEMAHGTNPLNPDTDRDGMSDGLEVARGYDPLNPGSPRLLYLPVITR